MYAYSTSSSVNPDPLGACLTYYYEDGGSSFFSHSIKDIITHLKHNNKPLEVDYDVLASNVVLGNLNSYQTPIKGVKLLPIYTGAVADKNGINLYSQRNDNVGLLTDEALKNRAIDEILGNVKAIADKHEKLVLEMTGGLDSRIVLSAALHLGLQDKICFFTRGKHDVPDRIISERLAHAFDIDLIDGPYGNEEISLEKFESNGSFCAGIRWLDDVAFRMNEWRDGFAILTGGMGGVWRNFYCSEMYYNKGFSVDYFNGPMSEREAGFIFDKFSPRKNWIKNESAVKELYASELCKGEGNVGQRLFHQYINLD
ncbi:hypothetical protein ACJJIU_09700 [Microbulbifer sp. CnH-101-E]|uniref:hypothetical protein n=1 Tax=unclassified Microbulbifer TaxID=2619833 RepID=UPI00403910CE